MHIICSFQVNASLGQYEKSALHKITTTENNKFTLMLGKTQRFRPHKLYTSTHTTDHR